MQILSQLGKNKDQWDVETAIEYLIANKNAFDFNNEMDVLLYNTALGTNYYFSEKYAEALPCLRTVTEIIDSRQETLGLASRPNLLLSYYWEANAELRTQASQETVRAKLERAKSMYENYGATGTEAYKSIVSDLEYVESGMLGFLADVAKAMQYVYGNDYGRAIPLLENVVNNWPSSQPKDDYWNVVQFLGNCYFSTGRIREAESIYLNILEAIERQGSRKELEYLYGIVCNALSGLYNQIHNNQKAKEYAEKSKRLYERNKDFGGEYIRSLSNIAIAEHALGHSDKAKVLVDSALKYLHQYEWQGTTDGLRDVSVFTGEKLDSAQLERSFRLRPYMVVLNNASMINQSLGFWDDAVACMKECIALSEEIDEPNGLAYNNLAYLYMAQNRMEEALPYLEKAMELCKTDYERNEININYTYALWHLRSEKCPSVAAAASKELTRSIKETFAFLSQEERFNYYKHFEFYMPLLDLVLYEAGDPKMYGVVLDNILTAKGLLLRTANEIKSTIASSGNESIIAEYDRLVGLRQQIANERDEEKYSAMKKETEQLEKDITRNATGYEAFVKANNIRWQDIQSNLKDEDVAIEFYNIPLISRSDSVWKAEPRYCAVVLKKKYEYPHIVPLCKESTLKDMDREALYETDTIFQLIWHHLEEEIHDAKNIYFSVDRELHKIGIEYALLPDEARMDEKYNMYRVSSTRILAEKRKESNAGKAVLFGGLRYDMGKEQLIAESRNGVSRQVKADRAAGLESFRYGVSFLPDTKEEVDSISAIFKEIRRENCETITGEDGTEEAFRSLASQKVSLIHLATHGFFWNDEEAEERGYVSFLASADTNLQGFEDAALLHSGLFFSGANIGLAGDSLPDDVEDGVLTAQELSAMNFGSVDMVVLSACQSGLGVFTGEGIFGLQRGFKLAGAKTLLMSLWKVDDEATKELMVNFYRHYLMGKSKREALRAAQQVVRKKYPNPEYWAAFIMLDGTD